jgi:transposase
VQRYVAVVCGRTRAQGPTVRVVDGEPGDECQVDFGRMGLLFDAETGRRRVVWALLFIAGYSRHQFLWLGFRQTTEAVIEGCEAAWAFFGGVFRTVIPDNMTAIVEGPTRSSPA